MIEPVRSSTAPVLITTPEHINKATIYKGLNALGTFILALNLFFITNAGYINLATAKWTWVGPVVMGIGSIAQTIQTYRQKSALVHDHTPQV